ncbi:hypothetical protein IFM89_023138 [Coptis chinensis]|uniref:Uncharacterized protein n=1 Tax=Coptis chinensis TaxID=261450 RepID=A0A835LSP8_9MAGN|nr:hypothetical protein IFM89_023138 [Coptis chinensis]
MEPITITWARHWLLLEKKGLKSLIHGSKSLFKRKAGLFCRYKDVNHYEKKAPYGKKAHPHPDHFYPLYVALRAAGDKSKAEQIHHSWSLGSISYASYHFTTN